MKKTTYNQRVSRYLEEHEDDFYGPDGGNELTFDPSDEPCSECGGQAFDKWGNCVGCIVAGEELKWKRDSERGEP